MSKNKKQAHSSEAAPAILGLDIVSYSELSDEKMFEAIKKLKIWIEAGLATAEIPLDAWNWSHSGDGGFLTFFNREAGYKAILVGFHILREARSPGFRPNNKEPLEVRAARHCQLIGSKINKAASEATPKINRHTSPAARYQTSVHGTCDNDALSIGDVCGYFTHHAHRMVYKDYLEEGFPIASGVIEGACRNVVKDRMEQSGMRWVMKGAHAMLSLRSIHLSGLWDDFIQHRIERETQRLYPHQAANDEVMSMTMVA